MIDLGKLFHMHGAVLWLPCTILLIREEEPMSIINNTNISTLGVDADAPCPRRQLPRRRRHSCSIEDTP